MEAIEPDGILVLVDLIDNQSFRVQDYSTASQVETGRIMFGAILWPDRDPARIAPGMMSYPALPKLALPKTEEPLDWAPLIEQAVRRVAGLDSRNR